MGQNKDNKELALAVEVKKMFFTQYDKTERFYMPECSLYDDEYELHNIKGVDELVKTGNKKPNYELIQSYKDECDINLTIQKISNGDPEALELYKKRKAMAAYADISDLSDNIIDNLSKVERFKIAFENLPSEIKSKYDNNYRKFISDISNSINDIKVDNNVNDEVKQEVKQEAKQEAPAEKGDSNNG